jgi:hypothetical protein
MPDSAVICTQQIRIFPGPVRARHPGGIERRDMSLNFPNVQGARRRYCITARHHFPSCCDFISSHKYQTPKSYYKDSTASKSEQECDINLQQGLLEVLDKETQTEAATVSTSKSG